ncbi:MAG: hypothetical protein HPM95_10620 [Alphaproteobacteria bacterium]|nr:hypothetical protein [Alphaproteobacteria bacterium]
MGKRPNGSRLVRGRRGSRRSAFRQPCAAARFQRLAGADGSRRRIGTCSRAEGSDPAKVEPSVPVTLVVDHLIVDVAGRPDAEARNIEKEYERNHERYAFFNGRNRPSTAST